MRDKEGYNYSRKVYCWMDHSQFKDPQLIKCKTNLLSCWKEISSSSNVIKRIKVHNGINQPDEIQFIESYNVFVKRFRETDQITLLIKTIHEEKKITIKQFTL